MTRLIFLIFTMLAATGLTMISWQKPPSVKQPNIILILSDDMGYSDIGCYGGEAATPNLDQLAREGLRYTQFYNTSRCCPSRASLLTGLDPHQAGMGWMTTDDFQLPGYRGDLSHRAVTIAEALKQAGYSTYMTGKWHLNLHPTPTSANENWPLQRGFEHYYGTLLGAASYYDPGYLCRDNKLITPENDPDYRPEEYYFTDAISDNSVNYIKARDKAKPFFMYVAYTAAHWPMQAPAAVIDKYKGRFDKGYESLRAERLQRMKKLGVIDASTALSPFDGTPWKEENDKPAMLRRMETYAAMIDVMDQGIGRIVKQLKADGIYDNTLIIYMQDNGACAELLGSGKEITPLAKNPALIKKPQPEALTYLNNPPATRDGKAVMQGRGVMAGPADTYVAYLQEWANVSNTPLRKFKHYVHEGGISSPLIMHWPAVITQKNQVRSEITHEMDIMPTILEAAKAPYPKVFAGEEIIPCEGKSLLPTFEGRPIPRTALFWEHEMNRAVRMGKWKLVSESDLKGLNYRSQPWELYDLGSDRAEMKNLAASHPDIVKKMSGMWEYYAKRCMVYPMPWKPMAAQ